MPIANAEDGIVLYDGVCVLCSASFRFVAARDPQARFRFTQIQSPYGAALAAKLGISQDDPESNAVIIAGTAYFRSDAVLQLLRRLPGWQWAGLLLAIPRPARDFVYNRIARNRYRMFGRTRQCLCPTPDLLRHTVP
jgi:predicted DCC family thiol-disulfide oxidoreductase YuxK